MSTSIELPTYRCHKTVRALKIAAIAFADSVIRPSPAAEVEVMAAKMYTSYCAAVGGKAHNGDPLPQWAEFRADTAKSVQFDAWVTAARDALPGEIEPGGAVITPVFPEYEPFKVSGEYVAKHNPKPGGYYVIYEDGYESYSPAKAFETGYEQIHH